ncbi:MAG: AMP-binding protein [Actinomycetota bacterium]
MAERHVLAALLEYRATEHPDQIFLKMPGVAMAWGEFYANVLRVARGFRDAGVTPGDRAAIMLPNCPEFLYAHFGAVCAGLSPVPVNTAQRGATLSFLLRDSGANAIVIDDALWPQYEPVRGDAPRVEIVRGEPPDSSATALSDVLAGPAEEPPVEEGGGTFGVLYTSGTTGPPKGVVPTRTDIGPLLAMWQAMEVQAGETMYTCLPLFHGNPLAISVLGAVFLDAQIAISERFSASRFWDEVRTFDAVEFNHVGAVISILLKQPERPDDRDNPMRVCLSAGCPPHAWEPFQDRFGVKIVEQFSMVDAPGYLINLDGKVGSMGKPVAGCEATILDDAGADLPAGRVGELALRAAEGRTHYYLNQPDATEEAFRGGWFHTGDLAWRDDEGFYYYAGRKRESMRRRGENVSAWEVENVVSQFPGVLESAAHAVASELGEDEIKVVVVSRDGGAIDPPTLLDFCAARMARYAVPRYVEQRDEIPKTPTQRPRYADLKAEGLTDRTWDREVAGYQLPG